jgi:hypothetical protein
MRATAPSTRYVATADYTPNQDKPAKYVAVREIEYRDDVDKTASADFSGFGY